MDKWYEICAIIYSIGITLFGTIAGTIAVCYRFGSANYLLSMDNRYKIKIRELEIKRDIAGDKYAHDIKMLES